VWWGTTGTLGSALTKYDWLTWFGGMLFLINRDLGFFVFCVDVFVVFQTMRHRALKVNRVCEELKERGEVEDLSLPQLKQRIELAKLHELAEAPPPDYNYGVRLRQKDADKRSEQ